MQPRLPHRVRQDGQTRQKAAKAEKAEKAEAAKAEKAAKNRIRPRPGAPAKERLHRSPTVTTVRIMVMNGGAVILGGDGGDDRGSLAKQAFEFVVTCCSATG